MEVTSPEAEFIRLAELADLANVHAATLEKYVLKGVINPDSMIKHGRTSQPIFRVGRIEEHLGAIKRYQEERARKS